MLLNNCINKLKDKARHIIDFEDFNKNKDRHKQKQKKHKQKHKKTLKHKQKISPKAKASPRQGKAHPKARQAMRRKEREEKRREDEARQLIQYWFRAITKGMEQQWRKETSCKQHTYLCINKRILSSFLLQIVVGFFLMKAILQKAWTIKKKMQEKRKFLWTANISTRTTEFHLPVVHKKNSCG